MSDAARREELTQTFDAIEMVADQNQNDILLMCVSALRHVHGLYPDADELRHRGSPRQQARVDIHNAIVAVLNTYLEAVDLPTKDAERAG